MIFTNREAALKQPNFRVGIQFESVQCQEGFERNISATFTFTNQELAKNLAVPMQSPLFFEVYKEDYKQKLEVELYENEISIGQIALRLPARPDYIYEALNDDIVNVDVKDHMIKIQYKFNVINKLISAQKENNYKKRYHSNNKRDTSFEKQSENKKILEQQCQNQVSQSQVNRSENCNPFRKNSSHKVCISENSENLPPVRNSTTLQQSTNKATNDGIKTNRTEGLQEVAQKITFEETINRILQENSQYANGGYATIQPQAQHNDQINYLQNQSVNPFETSRIDESSSELKIYSFQQANQEQCQQLGSLVMPDRSYSFSQQQHQQVNIVGGLTGFSNQIQNNESFSSKKMNNLPTTERKRNNYYFESPHIDSKYQHFTPQHKVILSPRSDLKSVRKSNNESLHLHMLPPTGNGLGHIDTTRTSKSQEIQVRSRRSLQDITSASRNNRIETQNDSYITDKHLPNSQGLFIDTLRQPYDCSLYGNSKELEELSQPQLIEYLKNLTVALQLRVQHLKSIEQENAILREDLQKVKGSRDVCLKTSENISQVSLQETVKLQQELEGIVKNSRCYLEQLKESRQEIEELKKEIQSEQSEKRDLVQQITELQQQSSMKTIKEKVNSNNTTESVPMNFNTENIKGKELRDLLERVIKEKNEAMKDNLNIKNDNIKLQQNLMELRLKYEELDEKNKQLQEQFVLNSSGLDNKDESLKDQLQQQMDVNKSLIVNIENLHQEKNSKQREFNNLSSQYEEQILFLQNNVQNMEMQLREVNQTNLELQANNLELSLTLKNIECMQKSKQVMDEDLRKEIEKNSTLYLQFQSVKQSNEVLFHKLVRANEQVKHQSDTVANLSDQIKNFTQNQDTTIQYLSYLSFLINDSYQPDPTDPFDKMLNEQIRTSKYSALIFIILRKIKTGLYQFGSQKLLVYIEDNQVKVKGSDSAIKYFERSIYTEIQKLISSLSPEKERQYNELGLIQNKWLEIKV